MTILEHAATDRYGRKATGIPPVQCAPWCTNADGHIAEVMREDQTCWGAHHYVDLSLEDVDTTLTDKEYPFGYDVDAPRMGPCAYRGFNALPCVYLHLWLPGEGSDGVDMSVKLTAAEASQLAADLIAVAREIGGAS
jgi:hypothetical protein